MWNIYVIMVSETRYNGELVEVQSCAISRDHTKAYIRTYKYKEKGGYNIAIRP